jgi:hypothetical protein
MITRPHHDIGNQRYSLQINIRIFMILSTKSDKVPVYLVNFSLAYYDTIIGNDNFLYLYLKELND